MEVKPFVDKTLLVKHLGSLAAATRGKTLAMLAEMFAP